MLLPCRTGSEGALLVTLTSGTAKRTDVVVVATLLPDAAVAPMAETVAVLVMAPPPAKELALTTRVKFWGASVWGHVGRLHTSGSEDPGAWASHVQPDG